MQGPAPDLLVCNAALSVCEKPGLWVHGLMLFDEMKRRGPRPDLITYNCIAGACASSGEWQRTLQLLQELDTATSDLQKSRHVQKSRVMERHNRGTQRKLKSHQAQKRREAPFLAPGATSNFALCPDCAAP